MRKKQSLYLLWVLGLTAFFVYLAIQKNALISMALRSQVKALTGTDAALEHVRIFKSPHSMDFIIEIEKMLVKNPNRFEIPNMAQLADIQIVLDPWTSLTKGRWHIRYLHATCRRLNFQNSGRNVLNISTMPAIRSLEALKAPVHRTFFWIERMEFDFEKIYRIDYSKSPTSFEQYSFEGRRVVCRNVEDPHGLVQIPLAAVLEQIHIGDRELISRLKAISERCQVSLSAA